MGNRNMHRVIGIDVGGTYTDAVDLEISENRVNKRVVKFFKAPTSSNVVDGVVGALRGVIESGVQYAVIMVGTTKFVNAVINRSRELQQVAVIRLCSSTTLAYPPFFEFPQDLQTLFEGHSELTEGGCEFDGRVISEVNEAQIVEACKKINDKNLKCVAISCVFGSLKPDQEIQVGEIVKREVPHADVTLSHKVAHIGLLARENASILNASLRPMARDFFRALRRAIREETDLQCPVFMTQNDGTLISMEEAALYPVKTFKCGPTNSMCGAAMLSINDELSDQQKKELQNAFVVDIGGTSTEIGLLVNGFPKRTTTMSHIANIPTNFNMPDVVSLAFGGGTTIEYTDGNVNFRESVGTRIREEAKCFGGNTATSTDYAVADGIATIGDHDVNFETKEEVDRVIDAMRNLVFDAVIKAKPSPDDVTVIFVGGGSELIARYNESLPEGIKRGVRPENFQVANAVGAAICKVSGTVDRIVTGMPDDEIKRQEILRKVENEAIELAVSNGAVRETVSIIEKRADAVAYLPQTVRVIIKAVGDLDIQRVNDVNKSKQSSSINEQKYDLPQQQNEEKNFVERKVPVDTPPELVDEEKGIVNENGEWVLNISDVRKINIGCSILGSGGGGIPNQMSERLIRWMREGYYDERTKETRKIQLRIMKPENLKENEYAVGGAHMGAPTIMQEKPSSGSEARDAIEAIAKAEGIKLKAIICLEIGGSNAITPLLVSACTNLPTIDADCMGRAFPMLQQTTLTINDIAPYPAALADDKGNAVVVARVKSFAWLERLLRPLTSEMGGWAALAFRPLNGEQTNRALVKNSYSHCWRIGNAVEQAKREHRDIPRCVEEISGGKVLFSGRIISVSRKQEGAFDFGIVVIDGGENTLMRIDYQNEYLLASTFENNEIDRVYGHKEVGNVVACVPEIICLLDENGDNIFSEQVRYGLLVTVLKLPVSEQLSGEDALKILGPKVFQYDVTFENPLPHADMRSVIE